jgi:membrane-associated phospholipid phosphatase
MPAPAGIGVAPGYFSGLASVLRRSVTQLVRRPSQPRRAEAVRRLSRQVLLLAAIVGVAISALMLAGDVVEIKLMPPRGTPSLWPVRILTDFGRDAYVLGLLAATLMVVAIIAARLRGAARSRLLRFGTQLQFMFFAVLVPVLAGEVIKWIAGRGRPFVGGKPDALNFLPFAGTEAHASFPSAHAITGFALAFAVTTLWPQAGVAMAVYAVLIALSRLVLLAHHPSDVVAGALIGVVGAMLVRYWFASRRLCFTIRPDGQIVPLAGASPAHRKGVARN